MKPTRSSTTAVLLCAVTVLAACSGGSSSSSSSAPAATTAAGSAASTAPTAPATSAPGATTTLPPATFEISPGVEQVTITKANPETKITVYDEKGEAVGSGSADANGALIVRMLAGGSKVYASDEGSATSTVEVMSFDDPPPAAFYAEQRLPDAGLGYITARDGTTLSASVWLPGPVDGGPYPTVVEYSGYSPSDPDSAGFPQMLTALGYAYVGVNMRGTGCSGGSYRYFEPTQSTDGYDVVEAVAAQPWVANHKVGMVGVSYPGITQLFVAQTQPPSLAAITPLSVISDSYRSTLYPGGLLNTGFAVNWMSQRLEEAKPSGQEWAAAQIANGDATCDANQTLRLQNPDTVAETEANPFWTDATYGPLAPRLFVDKINVPTFVAGAWQDEQTGGEFANMLDKFTGTDHLFATMTNGLHTESISPAVFPRWAEFLDIYVAGRTPSPNGARVVMPLLANQLFGVTLDAETVTAITPDRFAGMTPEQAKAAFEADPPIQVLFEEGAADGQAPGTPLPRYSTGLASWPPPDAVNTTFSLGADGVLYSGALPADNAAASGDVSYLALPDATPQTFYDGDGSAIWQASTTYDWQQGGNGTFASYVSAPFTEDVILAGSASVDLWITSNLGDTDLEVTISELRSDDTEVYVQSGWLRASERALDEAQSTPILPWPTFTRDDASLLPSGEPTEARVAILPFAHTFRAGSSLRLTVDAPGGNRPVWEFETIAKGEKVTISSGSATPSQLVVAALPTGTVDVPAALPACGSLRGQPCRPVSAG